MRPGEAFEAALASQPVSSGTAKLATEPLAPGAYEVALVDAEGEILARSAFWLYEPGAEPIVRTSRRSYLAGEPIEVAWTKAPGMKYDWVSVFRARKDPGPPQENCSAGTCGNGNYLVYEYTGARVEGSTNIPSRSLAPGRYEIRLLLDDGYRAVARSAPFRVEAP